MDVDFERIRNLYQQAKASTPETSSNVFSAMNAVIKSFRAGFHESGTTGDMVIDYLLQEPLVSRADEDFQEARLFFECVVKSKELSDQLQKNRGNYVLFEERLPFSCKDCLEERKLDHHMQYSFGRIAPDGPVVVKVDTPDARPPFRLAINTSNLYISYAPNGSITGKRYPQVKNENLPFIAEDYRLLDPEINYGKFPVFETLQARLDEELARKQA